MAEPNPTSVAPWYLRNINEALALDTATGNVYLRTGFTGDIIISGNVNIPGSVDAHISEIGTSGTLTVPWMPISIDGNSNVTIAGGNVNANVTGSTVGITGNIPGITASVTVIDGGGSLTVDGSVGITGLVNIGTMPAVNANITGGNVIVQQGTIPWDVSGNVTVDGTANVAFAPEATDAFGRLRVSNPYTLFDTNQRYYDHGQFSSSTSGVATVAYETNSSTFTLSVGTASGDSIIRETMRVFPYQPGKSLLVLMTGCMNAGKVNLRQRMGFFGAQNGVFFEQDGTTLNMVIRSYTSGAIVEDRVPQSSWNGDQLNGAGGTVNPSGITLNPALDQIWFCDIEWLGVGSVRVGFVIGGVFYTVHTFNHANVAGNTTTYMTTATLPIRYEITNTGVTASSSTFRQICCSVISEGGYNNFGTTQTAGTGTYPVNLSNSHTYYPIVSIRLAPTRLDSIVVPRQVDILSPSVNYYRWTLLQNATLTGATFAATSPTGTVQIDTAATAVSGGVEIQSGLASARELSELSAVDFFQYQIGRTLAGVSDIVTLAISAVSNNADVMAELGWQELT